MLKKSIFCVLVSCLLISNVRAQNYMPLIQSNKYWTIFENDFTLFCNASGAKYFYFDGDTIDQGITYNILKYYNLQSAFVNPFCPPYSIDNSQSYTYSWMREDTLSKKVYFRWNAQIPEQLVFDFSLNTGDTLFSQTSNCFILTVDSIGTYILDNGSAVKIIYLDNNESYIEGIGSSKGLFKCIINSFGLYDDITCVTQGGVKLFGSSCYGFTGVNELNENGTINVEIENNILFWEIDATHKSDNYKVELVSSNGSVPYSEICNLGKSSFSVTNLPKGIYFLKIVIKDKYYSKKILI